jgi:putative tricarboxylic transport membrane protein
VRKAQVIAGIFWIGLSLFVMLVSSNLGLGKLRNPGPGLMPFVIGLLLLLVSLLFVAQLLLKTHGKGEIGSEAEAPSPTGFWKISILLGSLIAYELLLEKLGYPIGTFLLLSLLLRVTGSKKWIVTLASSVLISLTSYFLFNFLGLNFPRGFFF